MRIEVKQNQDRDFLTQIFEQCRRSEIQIDMNGNRIRRSGRDYVVRWDNEHVRIRFRKNNCEIDLLGNGLAAELIWKEAKPSAQCKRKRSRWNAWYGFRDDQKEMIVRVQGPVSRDYSPSSRDYSPCPTNHFDITFTKESALV